MLGKDVFVHLFIASGIVLGAWNTALNKTDQVPSLRDRAFQLGEPGGIE